MAIVWLIVLLASLGGTVALGFIFRNQLTQVDQASIQWLNPELLQNLALKVLAISLSLYWVSQCAKNYRAHRHLEVANRHRATAFATFKSFMDADENSEVKSVILLEAARTAFSQVPTGYIVSEEDGPDSRLYELVKLLRGSR